MKIYLFIVAVFYFLWVVISHEYPDPSWWSIFSSNRSTHTPLIEQISLIKVTVTVLVFLGLAYLLRRAKTKERGADS